MFVKLAFGNGQDSVISPCTTELPARQHDLHDRLILRPAYTDQYCSISIDALPGWLGERILRGPSAVAKRFACHDTANIRRPSRQTDIGSAPGDSRAYCAISRVVHPRNRPR